MKLLLSALFAAMITLPGVAATWESPVPPPNETESSSPKVLGAARTRGARSAARDIKQRVFRILDYGGPLPPHMGRRSDLTTGYPLESIAGCVVTERFIAEVDAYNTEMRNWHAKHKL